MIEPDPVLGSTKTGLEVQSDFIGAGMNVGISPFGSWMLGVGANIGSMAFLFHSSLIAVGGPLASVIAWILAALIAVPLAFVLAELSSMFPTAGGPYVYKYFALKRLIPGMGELLGFLTGWIFWVSLVCGYACMSNGLVNVLSSSFFGNSLLCPIWFGPAVIIGLFGSVTVLNLLQVGAASRLNSALTLTKLGIAFAFAWLVTTHPGSSISYLLQTTDLSGNGSLGGNVAAVLPLAIAGFAGIELSGCTSSETTAARKSVPRAILLTVLTVAVIYIGMCCSICVVSVYELGPDKSSAMVPGTNFMATAPSLAGYLRGPAWGLALTAGVVLAIFSCGFTGLLSGSRTTLSMAQTGLFPARFAIISPKSRIPVYALWFQCVFQCALGVGAYLLARTRIIPDAYLFLGGTLGFLCGLIALLYGVCLLSLRYTDPNMARPFRVGRVGDRTAWVSVAFLGIVYSFVAFYCNPWKYQLAGAALFFTGLPVYGYYRWRR